jgi:S1-C subfamily serine protease
VNGRAVTDASDLQDIVFSQSARSTVTLELLRNGETIHVDVTLAVVGEQEGQESSRN